MKKNILMAALIVSGFGGLLTSQGARAAGAMNVDDAQVLDAGKCQLETWGKFNHDGTERWLNPSCNLTGNLEVSWGNAWQRDAGGMYLATSQLQGKTVFREMTPGGYGIGMLAGASRQTNSGEDGHQRSWDVYSKLLTSFSFRDDDVLVHTNVGFNRIGEEQTTRLSWGAGNETRLLPRLSFIGEVFGENKGKPGYQAGVRTILVPDRVEMDLTYGNTFGRETRGRYVVLGLRFITPELRR